MLIQFSRLWISRDDWRSLMSISGRGSALDSEAARAELLQRLVTAQEDERRRISRELHDTLGQYLTALQFGLQAVKGLDGCPADVAEGITKMMAVALRMDEEVERLSFELRPLTLDDLGLEDALRRHVQEWAACGIAVDLHVKNLDQRCLPAHVESTAYRVVQEALTNVRRHAKATRVSLIVERRRNELLVIIEDDGRGFDLEAVSGSAVRQRNFGLIGMRERAALVGGRLDIETEPGAGVTLYLRIPLVFDQDDGGARSPA
jgi:signal transduction histidine kinase